MHNSFGGNCSSRATWRDCQYTASQDKKKNKKKRCQLLHSNLERADEFPKNHYDHIGLLLSNHKKTLCIALQSKSPTLMVDVEYAANETTTRRGRPQIENEAITIAIVSTLRWFVSMHIPLADHTQSNDPSLSLSLYLSISGGPKARTYNIVLHINNGLVCKHFR